MGNRHRMCARTGGGKHPFEQLGARAGFTHIIIRCIHRYADGPQAGSGLEEDAQLIPDEPECD